MANISATSRVNVFWFFIGKERAKSTLYFFCMITDRTTQLHTFSSQGRHNVITINPFTVPACNISGLKVHGHPSKQSIFRLYITSTFGAMRFDENPFTCQCENKKAKGFRILQFYWLFSSDIMAVKGLTIYSLAPPPSPSLSLSLSLSLI